MFVPPGPGQGEGQKNRYGSVRTSKIRVHIRVYTEDKLGLIYHNSQVVRKPHNQLFYTE